jgi:hypothetical protein
MVTIRRAIPLLATALIVSATGCGFQKAAERVKKKNLLMQAALAYHQCHDTLTRGPKDLDEFKKYGGAPPDVNQALGQGDIVVFWDVHIVKDMPKGAAMTVLGYDKDVPAKGGWVLMGDASVKEMTAQEFAAAPRPVKPAK